MLRLLRNRTIGSSFLTNFYPAFINRTLIDSKLNNNFPIISSAAISAIILLCARDIRTRSMTSLLQLARLGLLPHNAFGALDIGKNVVLSIEADPANPGMSISKSRIEIVSSYVEWRLV